MSRFRDPTLLVQAISSIISVLVVFNVAGLTDENAALWMAVINALFSAVNAALVRPVAPALLAGLVTAVGALLAGYGFEIGTEKIAVINFALVNLMAFFFTRPNSTPVSSPQTGPGQGVTPADIGGRTSNHAHGGLHP